MPLLGDAEERAVRVPVAVAAGLAEGREFVLLRGAEPFEQLVFEREQELRAAGVALPAGAADELPVDPLGLVPLGADDVQAAGLGHARPELDVGAAAGHVRRHRHRARLPGLRRRSRPRPRSARR